MVPLAVESIELWFGECLPNIRPIYWKKGTIQSVQATLIVCCVVSHFWYQFHFLCSDFFNNIFGTTMKQTRPNWKRISHCWWKLSSQKASVYVCRMYMRWIYTRRHGYYTQYHNSVAELRTSHVMNAHMWASSVDCVITLFSGFCSSFFGWHSYDFWYNACKQFTLSSQVLTKKTREKRKVENSFSNVSFWIIYFVALSLCLSFVSSAFICMNDTVPVRLFVTTSDHFIKWHKVNFKR